MYGCESWTVKKAEFQRIFAFELWCWRRLLRVLWTARRSNQSILKEISKWKHSWIPDFFFFFWGKTKVLFQVCSPAYPAVRFVLQTVVLVEEREQSLLELRCWQGNILYKWFFAGRFSSVPSLLPRENAMRPWTWKWKKMREKYLSSVILIFLVPFSFPEIY